MKINDTNLYTIPNITPPALNKTYTDPIFNTEIKRLSDVQNTLNVDGKHPVFIGQEYSTINPFNFDSTKFLLSHTGYFALYDLVTNNYFPLSDARVGQEPRWTNDPNIFTYIFGNTIRAFDVKTLKWTEYAKFNEYSKLSMKGEADISFDGQHFVMVGNDKDIFVFDAFNRIKGKVLTTDGQFDSVYITPFNNVLIGWFKDGPDRFNGVEMYDSNMNFIRQLTYGAAHMDVTTNSKGDEILAWAAGREVRNGRNINGIVLINLKDASRDEILINIDWQLATHISGSRKDWIIVEFYAPSTDKPNCLYKNEIIRVNITTREIQRLCHHHSYPHDTYDWQPKSSCNREGDKIIFSSNFGMKPWPNYTDAYLMDLNKSNIIAAPNPTPTPVDKVDFNYDLSKFKVTILNGKLTLTEL